MSYQNPTLSIDVYLLEEQSGLSNLIPI